MIKKIVYSIFGALIFFAFFFLLVVYPNDSRINIQRSINISNGPKQKKIGTLFSLLNFEISLHVEEFKNEMLAFSKIYPRTFIFHSLRFESPYQSYTSEGFYPEKIIGTDTLILPQGTKLTVKPPAGSLNFQMEFSAFSYPGKNELTFLNHSETLLQGHESYFDGMHPLYKNFLKYVFPDRYAGKVFWKPFDIELEPNKNFILECIGEEKSYCVISNPTFWSSHHETETRARNLLFILIDTMRSDALNPKTTPTLFELAKKSTQFTNALAPGNMTSPSTNSILNCQSPSKIESIAFAYSLNKDSREKFYEMRTPSFPKFFSANGWKTAMIGNVSILSEVLGGGVNHGFETHIAMERESYDTPQITREAIQWLGENQHRPFFLYLHFHSPHAPYRPPFKHLFATHEGLSDVQSYSSLLKWFYRGEVKFTDAYIENVFSALKGLGLEENTDIVVTADHGDHHLTHLFSDNEIGPSYEGAYFDHGATLYNDEVHVPLILKLENQPPGVRSEFISLLDLAPTLLSNFQISIPSWCNGKILSERSAKESLFPIEGFRARSIVKDGRWKYIKSYRPTLKKLVPPTGLLPLSLTQVFSPVEIYDLKTDPKEQVNLVGTIRETQTHLADLYREYFNVKIKYEIALEDKVNALVVIRDRQNSKELTLSASPFRFELWDDFKIEDLEVLSNGIVRQLLFTSHGLKLERNKLTLEQLPIEPYDQPCTGCADVNKVILRRAEFDTLQERQILPIDRAFEVLLREWGYINDG